MAVYSQARAYRQARSAVARRDAQALGRLLERQPGEEPHLHQLGLDGVVRGELLQGLVQGQDVLCGAAGQQGVEVGGLAPPAAAAR